MGNGQRKREKGIEMLRLRRSALLFTSWGKVATPVSPAQPARTDVAKVDQCRPGIRTGVAEVDPEVDARSIWAKVYLRDHPSGIAMSGRRSS